MLSPEVDALITSGNRVVCCAEVKLRADSGDLKKLELKTARFDCEKVVVDGTNFNQNISKKSPSFSLWDELLPNKNYFSFSHEK